MTIELPFDGITVRRMPVAGSLGQLAEFHVEFDTPEAADELIERIQKAKAESCESDLRVLAGVE